MDKKKCLNCNELMIRKDQSDWHWEVKRFCFSPCGQEYNVKKKKGLV